jgi:tetratricopeptide (TPR) repeat protein
VVRGRSSRRAARLLLLTLLLARPLPSFAAQTEVPDPAAPLDRAIAAAESSLRQGELQTAEGHCHTALREGWLLLGSLEAASGRLPQAKEALKRASSVGVGTPGALASPSPGPQIDASAVSRLTPPQREELEGRVKATLARTYLNLGVMQAQGQRFDRAAELLEQAAALDPDLTPVQYSLGVAYFNAQEFEKATLPLTRALAKSPQDSGLRRMLALAWLNTEKYDKAAELLRDDPGREADPSLQYAYGLALVRSDQAAEAEAVFARLIARHGDSAEIKVVLGQAHAQQGDYDSAIRVLQEALRRKPDVAEANATLGVIYLKQGRLGEAEAALRAEVKARPVDLKSQHNLATVLDLEGRPEEAVPLLRMVLQSKPDLADARYLLGKVLLAQGAASEAAEQLEAAARLNPEAANVRYQLARAYQRLGRADEAERELSVYEKLKDERRGSAR